MSISSYFPHPAPTSTPTSAGNYLEHARNDESLIWSTDSDPDVEAHLLDVITDKPAGEGGVGACAAGGSRRQGGVCTLKAREVGTRKSLRKLLRRPRTGLN